MAKTVEAYVRKCDECQRTKGPRRLPPGKLQPIDTPSRPWEAISVDIIGPLPQSQGHDALLVVVDRFSKQIHAIPTQTELSAGGLARSFVQNVWKLHGLPKDVISDQGPQFVANSQRNLLLGSEPHSPLRQPITFKQMNKQRE